LSTALGLKLAFFALLVAFLGMRGYFAQKASKSGHNASFTDSGEADRPGRASGVILVIILLFMGGLLALYAGGPQALDWLRIPMPGWLSWLGVVLGAVAIGFQVWVHDTLQKRWFAATGFGQDHVLITEGPYRWVRHPMYSGLMLYFIALALVSAYWPFAVLAFLMIPLLYRSATSEEALLVERYPIQYSEYTRRTPRLIPRLRSPGA